MKIILSRKGFDSSNGKQPNPIMPDGTLLSLPIPDKDGNNTFDSLLWDGVSYYDIISSLKPKTKLQPKDYCHLDPDLRKELKARLPGWMPAFGQAGSALTHLRNHGVTEGDLFLFYGWFKETEVINGKLAYKKGARGLHVIYAYMQIGEIVEQMDKAPEWLKDHPHIGDQKVRNDKKNAIFLPTEWLSFMDNIKGCDVLTYRKDRILTKEGMTRRCWDLPTFFRDVDISNNPNSWKDDYFLSAAIGQEFVIDATQEIMNWVRKIFL